MIIHGANEHATARPGQYRYILDVTFDSHAEVMRAINMTTSGQSIRLYHPNMDTIGGKNLAPKSKAAEQAAQGFTVSARGEDKQPIPTSNFTESLRDSIKQEMV